ncbi:DUF1810 domain-containing protein [uncultured Roseovarius sp.]|uniref:DUF1810 domain-containing protein n=1 Tax=uncultured Roseovarius sp. TaxID=293344 RepID=UPI0026174504|nr:DUF1810 domain-containing protein [uncultured Roseovarius sp.]
MMTLERFVLAQNKIWPLPLQEIASGKKRQHWAWFVLPQVKGLGRSEFAKSFAIDDLDHARAYLAHPVLSPRLIETCAALLALQNTSAERVLGGIDALKLQSCATLFAEAGGQQIFSDVLARFYGGIRCETTRDYLAGRRALPTDDEYFTRPPQPDLPTGVA